MQCIVTTIYASESPSEDRLHSLKSDLGEITKLSSSDLEVEDVTVTYLNIEALRLRRDIDSHKEADDGCFSVFRVSFYADEGLDDRIEAAVKGLLSGRSCFAEYKVIRDKQDFFKKSHLKLVR
ncbi:hypothetical protein UFOVP244_141 [uncultured Caudovirales phage]|uniref:Uncharacterized protein n=1 Tax=uncultured Caudovirales phage TaxID=2100421 RepID=A0A6J7WWS4_9CAUD|nr:hypothetical protein UFOVP244_141 [uncultured Caudovirales phage]